LLLSMKSGTSYGNKKYISNKVPILENIPIQKKFLIRNPGFFIEKFIVINEFDVSICFERALSSKKYLTKTGRPV